MNASRRYIENLKKAWREEKMALMSYRAAAEADGDPARREIFLKMAEQERRHADRWEAKLTELGSPPGDFRPSLAERIRLRALVQKGTEAVAEAMEGDELKAESRYASLISLSPSDKDRREFIEIQAEEKEHDSLLGGMIPTPMQPMRRLQGILGKERWHVQGGGWIGQAIYGINDGLGAAFGVVSGVAGATHVNSSFVLLSGFASMIASALSMGSGAYLATKSEREVYQAEMNKEKREIAENPEEEREELSLFYQLKGFSEKEAHAMAERMSANTDEMLKVLAHEELGLSERAFPNEWKSALSATVSTAIGAVIPVLPYVFSSGLTALLISFIVSTAAHFAVGAAKVIVTGRSWLKSGLEMMLIGLGEAAITYGIGLLISPVLG
jgi:VIT1/CCC1 family predicted Fe2+/Mn2+ transporter/rubrerythrin